MTAGDVGNGGGDGNLAHLGSHFEELRSLLASARGGPPDPERVVGFAIRAVPNARHCGLTLIRQKTRPITVAASDEVPVEVDRLQYRLGEGPCLTATGQSAVARADDLRASTPWPAFARAAVETTGVRSMFSIQLVLSGEDVAAMNYYAERPAAFDDDDIAIAAIFAPFAAMALQSALHEREASHLHTALHGSRQIGTAIGILMARQLVTSQEAFDQLVSASQHLNRKLRDIAAEVEETGVLPEPKPSRRSHRAGGQPA